MEKEDIEKYKLLNQLLNELYNKIYPYITDEKKRKYLEKKSEIDELIRKNEYDEEMF